LVWYSSFLEIRSILAYTLFLNQVYLMMVYIKLNIVYIASITNITIKTIYFLTLLSKFKLKIINIQFDVCCITWNCDKSYLRKVYYGGVKPLFRARSMKFDYGYFSSKINISNIYMNKYRRIEEFGCSLTKFFQTPATFANI